MDTSEAKLGRYPTSLYAFSEYLAPSWSRSRCHESVCDHSSLPTLHPSFQ